MGCLDLSNLFVSMTKDILSIRNMFRKNFLEFTRKAFYLIPNLHKPRILDIGCGSGIPTIELALLSNGYVIAIDINQSRLEELSNAVSKLNLVSRIEIVRASMEHLSFSDESFDIIWTEGAIITITFKKRLQEWRHLLKPSGYLVIHDEINGAAEKQETISICGYKLIDEFIIPPEVWWCRYYSLLENHLEVLGEKYGEICIVHPAFKETQEEIDAFKENPRGSAFLIMQKSTA
jgi:ubiquinone/menaquinone biosynthesis C-methylase UbiE